MKNFEKKHSESLIMIIVYKTKTKQESEGEERSVFEMHLFFPFSLITSVKKNVVKHHYWRVRHN